MLISYLEHIRGALLAFLFFYPLFMAYLWMIGAIYYYWRRERNQGGHQQEPKLREYPWVSLVVPCFNEGENVRDTIAALAAQTYPNFDIIAVNDGSSDDTGAILDELAQSYPQLRVLHFSENQGKAMGLRMAALSSPHEFLVCIDGDALLDPHATTWIMSHFVNGARVGAVTGNPRIRTRSTLLGKVQVGEFSAIIGMIKRAQRIYGRIFTVSGVVSGFRKAALHRVGYWSLDKVTEDIDISWKMQLNHWDIRFEPNALCWILMPETLRGLWKQRLRWAQGGYEVLLANLTGLFNWKRRRMWPVVLEFATSVIWSYSMLAVAVLWVLGYFLPLPDYLELPSMIPHWPGVVLGLTCLLQFAISLAIDSRYEKGLGRFYYWMIWYPLAFWLINLLTAIVGLPKALFRERGRRATWVSPDRGVAGGTEGVGT
ncbi:poly-beta-1,6-N-acetyl-D-glucosamine synthase [Geoalkalibacter halelectricus]|uniref:Poly-beta-1,6-N-acetyl-D-glucosamine synthase n=1 Tax=Geoalkalibacter halelectricus TaxID=2847045 RepID=A0ABY5ZL31_9BACT|nr:poly-beta-1,6-N-acetyl-D-glucosamine synthase [Geoalkalibacter halelectricus]MDO3378869.1 poly-beta-1,6-N-acetyl-D-glucosamine synthase [Geoalkalibacter halelectricus]UWZ79828.1 poly-beta-1,6-N-acetyl-D-glucosamine synthase [Geoalkalibacter halelectricus]